MVEISYGIWLSWLRRRRLLASRVTPWVRVTPERVRGYICDLRLCNAPFTVSMRIAHLCIVVTIMAPAVDFEWLRVLQRRLYKYAVPGCRKDVRLRPSSDLLRYGVRLMEEAEALDDARSIERSMCYRDGLMIALLAARPLRLRNFVEIQIGKNLLRFGERYYLVFEANETKWRRPLEFDVPVPLQPFLERYLGHHRPTLLAMNGWWRRTRKQTRSPEFALWVSTHGTALRRSGFFCRLWDLTKREFGVAISPHLFRHCAATSIATEDPGDISTVLAILGHTTVTVAERYYNQASTVAATRRYHEAILKLRPTMDDSGQTGGASEQKRLRKRGGPG